VALREARLALPCAEPLLVRVEDTHAVAEGLREGEGVAQGEPERDTVSVSDRVLAGEEEAEGEGLEESEG
jgi:hypothetical protein